MILIAKLGSLEGFNNNNHGWQPVDREDPINSQPRSGLNKVPVSVCSTSTGVSKVFSSVRELTLTVIMVQTLQVWDYKGVRHHEGN
ncbi:hypothetical protein [Cyclobacterium qasimii]|uniref:hypothetical protein n=1 Tax=Cyclobacterium qasimii TaxID=1350429 RepID=UPI0011BEE308|nr:hypothetical protein [Cyclobacterium qasimii]